MIQTDLIGFRSDSPEFKEASAVDDFVALRTLKFHNAQKRIWPRPQIMHPQTLARY